MIIQEVDVCYGVHFCSVEFSGMNFVKIKSDIFIFLQYLEKSIKCVDLLYRLSELKHAKIYTDRTW
jgi:hypothetical protein